MGWFGLRESPGFKGSIKVSALPFNPLSPTPLPLPDAEALSSYTQDDTISSTKGQNWSAVLDQQRLCCLQVSLSHRELAHTNTQTTEHLVLHAALLPRRADGALPVLAEGAPHGNGESVFIPDAPPYVLSPSRGSPLPLLQTAWLPHCTASHDSLVIV